MRRGRPLVFVVTLLAGLLGIQAVAAFAQMDTAASLVQQIDHALTHAGFALGAPNDQGFRTHSHHVVNILVGGSGMGFDASFGNPGDGYGALEYARDLRAHADVAAAGWQEAARNIALWLERASAEALQAARAADRGDTTMARVHLVTALAFISAAKGREGETAPVAGALSLQAALPAAGATEDGGTGGYY